MNDDIWAEYAKGVEKKDSKKKEFKKTAPKKDKLKEKLVHDAKVAEAVLPEAEKPKTEFEKLVDETPMAIVSPPKEPANEPVREIQKEQKQPTPQPQVLDIRIERNLSLGDVMIEAKIDLHGKTEADAHDAFQTFVKKQEALNRRLLLIITGKSGVLRQNLPRWCDVPPLSDGVLALRTAAPHHGGDGAYYLLLRKRT